MLKKLFIAATAAMAIGAGTFATTAPAQAKVHVWIGVGPHHSHLRCKRVWVKRNHHWVLRRVCRPYHW